MTNIVHVRHRISNTDQLSTSAPEKATYDFDDSLWHILNNMFPTGPVWLVIGNGGQLWSRISSLYELVHFKSELRDLGLVYQVIACTALWAKIGQNCSKVAYNSTTVLTVPRYGRLGPYLSMHYPFWAVLSLSVRFDHIKIKAPGKRESGQKWSIIIQNVVS